MDDDELKSVKDHIVSTLTAGGTAGYTIDEFDHLFEEDWFMRVPYERLGFKSLVEYLQSIPDCVLVTRGLNGVQKVRVVKSNETATLISLVDRTERKQTTIPAKLSLGSFPPGEAQMLITRKELSVELLVDQIRESKQIRISDLKAKVKKRLDVELTLDKLNALFNCNAASEVEAYQIGLAGAVIIIPSPAGSDDGSMTYIKPASSMTPSSSCSSIRSELTYETLLEMIKESKTIQVADLKIKVKKRLNVTITLDLLNRIFQCNARTPVEAYQIGLGGVCDVKETKNGNGTIAVLRSKAGAFTKESILNEVRRKKKITLRDLHAHYQKTYNSLLTTEVINEVLGTNARSPLAAIRQAFAGLLLVDNVQDGGSDWDCTITASIKLLYAKKSVYTKQTLISNVNKFTTLFLNGHERYAVEWYDVPDLGLETLNRILGTSEKSRRDALTKGLAGIGTVFGNDSNISIRKIEQAAPPADASGGSVKPILSKKERFVALLERKAPIYASNLWKEFRREFDEEATLAVLQNTLEVVGDSRMDALKAFCGDKVQTEPDLVLDTFLIFYPADVEPRRTNDFLRYQFVALVKTSKTISLFNLCVKLKKQFQVEYNLPTMNTIFCCRERSRRAVIERSLSGTIALAGKEEGPEDKGLRLQLTYVGGSKKAEEEVEIPKFPLVYESRVNPPPPSVDRPLPPPTSAEPKPSTSDSTWPVDCSVPPPPLPISPPRQQQKPVAPATPVPAKPAPVATVAPLNRTITKDTSSQTKEQAKPKPTPPTNITKLADELAEFLQSMGGIRLSVLDVAKLFKHKYKHCKTVVFPATYAEGFTLCEKMVFSSCGKLNLIYFNEVAFVQLFDKSSAWNPSIAKSIKIPLTTDQIKLVVTDVTPKEFADGASSAASSPPSSAQSATSTMGNQNPFLSSNGTSATASRPKAPAPAPPLQRSASASKATPKVEKDKCVIS